MFKKIGSIFFITLFFISGNSVFAGAIDKRPQFVKDFEEGRFDYFKNQSIAPLKIRGLASEDPNNQQVTSPAMEGFKKFLKKKKSERKIVNQIKDRQNCKMTYYGEARRIKTQICDFNEDGVVDMKARFNRDGLKLVEFANTDGDKFFEQKIICKALKENDEVAKCTLYTDLKDKNKYTDKESYFVASYGKAIRNRNEALMAAIGQRQSRGIASKESQEKSKDRFDDSKLFSADRIENYWYANSEKSFKFRKHLIGLIRDSSGEKAKHREYLVKNNWKVPKNPETSPYKNAFKGFTPGEDITYMKYFTSFGDFDPNQNMSCLRASRDCCQGGSKGVDYQKVGGSKNEDGTYGSQLDYTDCMHYSMFWCKDFGEDLPSGVNWCNADKAISEGDAQPCFDCMISQEYANKVGSGFGEIIAYEDEEITPPKGFIYNEVYDILIHESCNDMFDGEFAALGRGNLWCNVQGEKYESTLQGNIHMARFERALHIHKSAEYAKLFNSERGKKILKAKDALDTWGAKKEDLKELCKKMRVCENYLYEESPMVKVFCKPIDDKTHDQTIRNSAKGYLFRDKDNDPAILYAPPIVILNETVKGNSRINKETFADHVEEGIFDHAMYHVLGHQHHQAKWIEAKKKYRCGWTIEPDYANLCDPEHCVKGSFEDSSKTFGRCDMRPNEHIDPKTGDLTEDYMTYMARNIWGYFEEYESPKSNPFKLVDDPSECM
ncbi:MAG: hypothetical protein CL674_02985 [Bdellovibrionaceae bacterium]|nr:hypothetical protein [Pseudobdellovibrionaceae bacterium]|tara:strand:+ start:195874 stop:198036 length:2163 start_codon:yes stop_codon:yes gene_type:complete